MISVALCTYNGEKYISQQLDSILTQSMPVDEIVINDDCSTDSTMIILNDYASQYPQIKYKTNSSNIGFVKNFEKTISECYGDYIFFSDQDDIWKKDKVKITIDYLKETGMYGVFTDGLLIDQFGRSLGDTLFSRIKLIPYIENSLLGKYAFEVLCLNRNYVTGATLAITKTAKKLVIPFKTSSNIYHDMWVALKLSANDKLGYINQQLISYRIHPNQECGLYVDEERDRDKLIGSFLGKGCCEDLLSQRRRSIIPIYYCNLSFKEKYRIFSTYCRLYIKSLKKESLVKDIWRFIKLEMIVLVKTTTGIKI